MLGGILAVNLAKAGFALLLLAAGDDWSVDLNEIVPAYYSFSPSDPKTRWDLFVKHCDSDVVNDHSEYLTWSTIGGGAYVGLDPRENALVHQTNNALCGGQDLFNWCLTGGFQGVWPLNTVTFPTLSTSRSSRCVLEAGRALCSFDRLIYTIHQTSFPGTLKSTGADLDAMAETS